MPDAKYFNRSEKGVTKHTLGMDNEDISIAVPKPSVMHTKLMKPTEATCDKPVNQDGGLKPWKPMGRKGA